MSLAFHEETRDAGFVFGPFRLEAQPSGIALLRFDDPARKVNLLDSASIAALRDALESIRSRTEPSFPRALVIASGKADATEREIRADDRRRFAIHLRHPPRVECI